MVSYSYSSSNLLSSFVLCVVLVANAFQCFTSDATSTLMVDGSPNSGRPIPNTFLGAFFEEINHAGAGGLWAELVSNRGFEGGRGSGSPSSIYPWRVIGNESLISVSTDQTSCFERNKIALRMEVLCNGPKSCPPAGVGVSNPGYWGMNIEKGKKYKLVMYVKVKASGPVDLQVSLTGSVHRVNMVSIISFSAMTDNNFSKWTKVEGILESKATNHNSNLQITTTTRAILWLDQVSLMPLDTYKGHGFRMDLFKMVADLKPKFLRFPGGCFVEGYYLKNGFQWKNTIGAWEQRPGHYGDVWKYWTDDGFGFFEMLQLAEDLGALPIWVFNNGMSVGGEEVNMSALSPFIQIYPNNSMDMFSKYSVFDKTSRLGPKVFVSEYAVVKDDARNGTLLAALAEAAFLIGLERNSDIVHMVCYAPLFINKNGRYSWIPDAIAFNSHESYGTPSYWVQQLFSESSGAIYLNSTLQTSSNSIVASAIGYRSSQDSKIYLRVKVVNFGSEIEKLRITINGLSSNVQQSRSTKTVLTSSNKMDENSFSQPNKVVPRKSALENASNNMVVSISPYSVTSFDLLV
ncbi:alpha-L-arabinofuranosidase 1-like isoform X2 [Arachis ipaensis]|uniref:alpha-L-arabinofuranosidase 1-like isoform X2 n=1 Tax=Arachis ipaensis TaxID=130454 RepID=UPI000A2B91F2|nr:alpha-L-arabinofuranosidase 1-like isoform X2 [Arachis ipaensis]